MHHVFYICIKTNKLMYIDRKWNCHTLKDDEDFDLGYSIHFLGDKRYSDKIFGMK